MSYITYSEFDSHVDSKTTLIRCPFKNCHARVIPLGSLVKVKVADSPDMTIVEHESSLPPTEFYQINDVWDFDNIGVSRPSLDIKQPVISGEDGKDLAIVIERLLICSECDKGPIGFAGILNEDVQDHKNLKYFLSCSSVLYETK